MINTSQDVAQEFYERTQKNLQDFFERISLFLQTDRLSIVNYYEGKTQSINSKVFQNFLALERELKEVFGLYELNKHSFIETYWWDLLEVLEQVDNVFNGIRNTPRWSRASPMQFGYDSNIQVDYTLAENQTLERVSQDLLSNPNIDNWYNIAVDNDLKEEDYTINGGKEIKLSYSRINKNYNLRSVVDLIYGKSIYGIDLDRKITFVEDEDGYIDLKLLSYDETALQSIDILITLRKNSHPDYPEDGLQRALVVGGNRAMLNFPVVIRQLTQNFATDDTFKNFKVTNMAIDQDNVNIDYQVQTRLDEVVEDIKQL